MRRPVPFEELMPISRVSTEIQKTGLWGKLKPLYQEGIGPCRESCPLGTDIPLFVSFVKEGDFVRAKETILFENPFPAVCGRVCYHPCETSCNRREFDSSVLVRALERFVGDHISFHIPISESKNSKKVAIVGSGPAGLSCAYFLLRLGHRVTIFEKERNLGGLLRWGIPPYRLPKEVLEREISRLLALNPKIELKREISGNEILSLLREFDYVFLGVGLGEPKTLNVEGAEKKGIHYGFEFLKNRTIAEDEVWDVVVIGGGDVAMDAARTVKRLRPKATVRIFAPETVDSLPALKENFEEAKEEGIEIEGGYVPIAFRGREGVESVIFRETEVRRDPMTGDLVFNPKDGIIEAKADTVIVCIGQRPEKKLVESGFIEGRGFILTDRMGRTKIKGIYAGGDVTGQKASVSDALSSGKKAAIAIDMDAKGLEIPPEELSLGQKGSVSFKKYLDLEKKNVKKVVFFSDLNTLVIEREPEAKIWKEPPKERIVDFREVSRTLEELDAKSEASRCLTCGQCRKCDLCFYLCPDVSVKRKDEGLYEVNEDYCKSCGICVRTCPSHVIEMVEKNGGATFR
ncbi:MAG: FAD-dependent oxidoreductase [Desulfobacterota bacterium]|nr:FAD-dependent oxidoreductase [Thermodesulfobacteriota bacterium]MDW8001953.1 FAD-dependent oxidoreductase [Deltaproteobacteria bacterium]